MSYTYYDSPIHLKPHVDRLLNEHKIRKGKVRYSLEQLLYTGKTRTGSSYYRKGWAHKDIWTVKVLQICDSLKISVTSGNDAPKGGANGEYVALANDFKNDVIKSLQKIKKQ